MLTRKAVLVDDVGVEGERKSRRSRGSVHLSSLRRGATDSSNLATTKLADEAQDDEVLDIQ